MRTQYIGCSKYGTAVMPKEDVLSFVEITVNNGSDIAEALADMRMIDALLSELLT